MYEKGRKKLRLVESVREPVRFDLTGLIIKRNVYSFRQGTVEVSQNTTPPRERAGKNTPTPWVGLGGMDLHTVYINRIQMHMYGLSM